MSGKFRKKIARKLDNFLHSGKFGDTDLRKKLFSHLPDQPLNYVDIGAYNGDFFQLVTNETTISKALLVEPQPALFNLLQKRFSGLPFIRIENCLLSDSVKTVTFHTNRMGATSSILDFDSAIMENEIDISGERGEMRTTTLDELLKNSSDAIDLLKVDVQGAELEVLRGAPAVLQRTAHIWIEVSFKPLYVGSPVFHEIFDFLVQQNFSLISVLEGFRSKKGELLQADCLFRKNSTP